MIILFAGQEPTPLINALSNYWPTQIVLANTIKDAYKEIKSWPYLSPDVLYVYPNFAYPNEYLVGDGLEVDYRTLEARLLDVPIVYLPPLDPERRWRYDNWTYLTLSKVIKVDVKDPYSIADTKQIAKKLGLPDARRIE